MPSTTTILAGDVAAPIDRVFSLLSDPARIPEWLPGCHEVSGASVVRKGARLEVRFGHRSTAFEIIEFAVPTTLGWNELGHRAGSKTFFQLGFAGATTALKMMHLWAAPAPSIGTWWRAHFRERRNPKRMLDQTLQNLRKLTTR